LNKSLFDSNWKKIRSLTTTWWSLVGDHDLLKVDKAEEKYDKVVTMLRVKYGYTNDQAKKEVNKRMAAYENQDKSLSKPA